MIDIRSGQRGYAILIVLWAVALLSMLVSHVLASAREEMQLTRSLSDTAQLQAAADGAVQRAIFLTLDGSSRHWPPDDTAHTIQVGRVPVALRIESEADKVNPNIAPLPLIQALLVQVGADPAMATNITNAIGRWRADANNVPIVAISELETVFGMPSALLNRLRPHLSVFSDRDPVSTSHDPVVARALATAGLAGLGYVPDDPGTLSVTVDARGPGDTRFLSRTIVEINAQAEQSRYHILSYERLWGEAAAGWRR